MATKSVNTAKATEIFASMGLARLNEELSSRGLKTYENAEDAATILAMGVRSLDEFTATMVNLTHGELVGKALTPMLAMAFPDHGISDRHGPHYLSLCRTGETSSKIKCRFEIDKARRPKKAGAEPTVVEVEKIVEKIVEVEKTYDLSTMNDNQIKRLLGAVKGTPLEDLITKCLATKNEVAVETKPETEVAQPTA